LSNKNAWAKVGCALAAFALAGALCACGASTVATSDGASSDAQVEAAADTSGEVDAQNAEGVTSDTFDTADVVECNSYLVDASTVDSSDVAATVGDAVLTNTAVDVRVAEIAANMGLDDAGWEAYLDEIGYTQSEYRVRVLGNMIAYEQTIAQARAEGTLPSEAEVDARIDELKAACGGEDAWAQSIAQSGYNPKTYREEIIRQMCS
jgi:hypothetical protein